MRVFFISLISLILFSCTNKDTDVNDNDAESESNKVETLSEEDRSFNSFKGYFVEELWKLNPSWASHEGFHAYDSVLRVPNEAYRNRQMSFADKLLDSLESFDFDQLTENNKTDFYLMENHAKSSLFYLGELKSWEWNPASYNLGGSFFSVLDYRESPLYERLSHINLKLVNVPEYYIQAKLNIQKPTKEHTELAISQLKGSLSIFTKSIPDSLEAAGSCGDLRAALQKNLAKAITAIEDFAGWLEFDVLPNLDSTNSRDFRLGEELYNRKFDFDIQSMFNAKEIYNKAIEEKVELNKKMFVLADSLWGKYYGIQKKPLHDKEKMIRMIIDTISIQHVHRDSFITAIKQQIPELEKFVRNNNLLGLDEDKPLKVRETPDYMRGVAGASISAPGPYDVNATTYYNVTPLDDYSEESAESYLREYNKYMLQILNIHEAVPGHYTQLVYSNKSPSIIKSILGNGAMIEGWAVYTERMMLENGYGNNSPELWLMYYKWNLRTICNTILDYSVHVKGMNEEEAMDLLVKQAFQQKAEAEAKWKRAKVSQVQLCSYFTGYYEIMALREEMQKNLGKDFDLKKFHEDFLSFGSAPVKYIRLLMLEKYKLS